jgi:hypothetical protein
MMFYGLFIAEAGTNSPLDGKGIRPPGQEQYSVFGVEIPSDAAFAGEPMPLDLFDVREALDRELLSNTYFHSQTIRLIKLSNRYFPMIEPILKEYGLPDDFKYLAVAESGLEQVVSPAKAVGFWQLLRGTAAEYGLEVNDEVDERYDIEKSTGVACQYMLESYEKYGNWTMTAASYNAGRRGVDRQIERQKTENYYDLLLNDETERYLFRLMAFKLIFEDPDSYGITLSENELYSPIPYEVVEVSGPVEDFADFAAEHHTNYKILKYLNPWLRDNRLTNSAGKTYAIKIPEEGFRRPDAWNMGLEDNN